MSSINTLDFLLLALAAIIGIVWLLFKGVPSLVVLITKEISAQQGTVVSDLPSSDINLDSIKDSLTGITHSLRRVSDNIEVESSQLEMSISDLLEQVQAKDLELQSLNQKAENMVAEIEKYKTLASLTKEQAEVVRQSLKQGNLIERFSGFGVGIFSAILSRFLYQYIVHLFKEDKKDKNPS